MWGCVESLIYHYYCHLWTFISPISTILHHFIYYNLSFKSILLIIYALMNKYYLFSFISNKLIIMHYFTNDSSNKLVITLFTIFSLQGNFQIEDLIFKSANSEIRWFKKWQFCGWDSEQMKTNLRNPEHGFCPERAQLTLTKNGFLKFGMYKEKRRVLWARFSQICSCDRPPNFSYKPKSVLLLLKIWEGIYFLVDHLVRINLNL